MDLKNTKQFYEKQGLGLVCPWFTFLVSHSTKIGAWTE